MASVSDDPHIGLHLGEQPGEAGALPNPAYNNEMLRDAVPTAAVELDGAWYVSLLTGAPFLPGTAKVIKIDADGVQSDFATGLTMLTDMQAGPDGNLYAVQFAMFGEQGPMPFSGAIVRVGEGDSSTVVVPGLLCLLYTSPSPRDRTRSRMPSSA